MPVLPDPDALDVALREARRVLEHTPAAALGHDLWAADRAVVRGDVGYAMNDVSVRPDDRGGIRGVRAAIDRGIANARHAGDLHGELEHLQNRGAVSLVEGDPPSGRATGAWSPSAGPPGHPIPAR